MSVLRRLPVVGRALRRLDTAIRWRIDEAVAPLRDEVGRARTDLDRVDARSAWTANEMERLQPHVAALDARIEDLRTILDDQRLTASEGELGTARSLLDEMRAEHAVIRARLSAISLYEERIRRLEDTGSLNQAACVRP
jgi:predicted  nucleic acid-binding Zn-ribbon protein